MGAKLFLLALIGCQFLLRSGDCFEAKRFFGVGKRIPGDQLLVKDVRHSRPAGAEELPRVDFTYEVLEPITCVEILSEENISAEVIFSLVNRLIVGMVRLAGSNESGVSPRTEASVQVPPPTAFDVTIMIFGLNETAVNYDPSMIVNPDQQYEGEMEPYSGLEVEQISDAELYDNNQREALEVEEEDLDGDHSYEEIDESTEGLFTPTDYFDKPDKIIEIGQRQPGDQLVYDCYHVAPDDSADKKINRSVIFYYIDSASITYVKFVIMDHFGNKNISDPSYVAPVAEYSHFSRNTLKAVITDFDTESLFVKMFIYGYPANEAPTTYVPFLPPPHWQGNGASTDPRSPLLTPVQTMQLLLMTGQKTTPPPVVYNDSDTEKPGTIKAEDMEFTRITNDLDESDSAMRQLDSKFVVWLGLLLLLVLHH
ncbi:uncharacterized protein LOC110177318 [Drosophila serrata]|uniref:uncharacterized protein LOC110177318 n=1 Tax=Drosophila serrata TaxID=7274 RepID=UPI000A1D22E6|nr:uncharacterized protein LOC110177318 [Drosophila serrata]